MAYRRRWYHFYLKVGRYWSIGWNEFGFHILTHPFAVSWSSPEYARLSCSTTGWLFSWSFDSNHQGGYIHKYHWDLREGSF